MIRSVLVLLGVAFSLPTHHTSQACCAVSRAVDKVVNADQTVIILWDAETKQQHFIRQASFKSGDAKDIGFIVPSPTKPELEESGDEAFTMLKYITAPLVRSAPSFSIGCGAPLADSAAADAIEVLEEKRVAGFDAVVLKAGNSGALVEWLAENGYAYSDAVAEWAEPYIEQGWPFTALKVAADATEEELKTAALRISFQTDAPLFPYREPDSAEAAKELGAKDRLLRIYFVADQAYDGEFENGSAWTGMRVWSGDISHARDRLLENLAIPATSATPKKWWLTEFEDKWPYKKAPGDVLFSPSKNQKELERTAHHIPGDPFPFAIALIVIGFSMHRKLKGLNA